MSYEFHPEASSELEEHAAWYEARRAGLGVELLSEARGVLHMITEHPRVGALWQRGSTIRLFPMSSFPFRVVYTATEKRVSVIAFAHMRRRPDYWTTRMQKH